MGGSNRFDDGSERSDSIRMKRVKTGELLYRPRLEKAVSYLQHHVQPILLENTRLICPVSFSVSINHYARMIISVMLDRNDEEDDQYLISGIAYTIELIHKEHVLVRKETNCELLPPAVIAEKLVKQMEKYDLSHLFFCIHCGEELVERTKDCCASCDMYKITYHDMCPICHDDDYFVTPSVWAALDCGHVFHRHCILPIKEYAPNRIRCPMCRKEQVAMSEVL